MSLKVLAVASAILAVVGSLGAARAQTGAEVETILSSDYERLTSFGERPSWSPDGRRIAFMEKSFGDAFEIDLDTKKVRLLTYFQNPGFLRVQFLPNGDYLLIGARDFKDIDRTRYYDQEFWVMKADGHSRPVPLDQKVSEGVAISRKSMKIAWANDFRTSPGDLAEGECAIFTGDIVFDGDKPRIVNRKEAVRIKGPGCRMEAQDFRNDDKELVYIVYRDTPTVRLADIFGVDLVTGRKTTYRRLVKEYNEAEGIFPDGRHILVESDREQTNAQGSKTLDIWKLRLEPEGADFTRVTRFGDMPGHKATNPVVSPDGRRIAFQEARSTDVAGSGHGLFLLKIK